jgi:hypothetical protein
MRNDYGDHMAGWRAAEADARQHEAWHSAQETEMEEVAATPSYSERPSTPDEIKKRKEDREREEAERARVAKEQASRGQAQVDRYRALPPGTKEELVQLIKDEPTVAVFGQNRQFWDWTDRDVQVLISELTGWPLTRDGYDISGSIPEKILSVGSLDTTFAVGRGVADKCPVFDPNAIVTARSEYQHQLRLQALRPKRGKNVFPRSSRGMASALIPGAALAILALGLMLVLLVL